MGTAAQAARDAARADAAEKDMTITAITAFGAMLGVVAIVLGMLLAPAFVDGLVLMPLWRWFAVPLGAPTLAYWPGVGLLLLVRLIRPSDWPTERKGQGSAIHVGRNFLLRVALMPLVILAIGALVHAAIR